MPKSTPPSKQINQRDTCHLGCGIVHSLLCEAPVIRGGEIIGHCTRAFHHPGECEPTLSSSPETPADFRQLVRSALPNASCHGMEEEIDADFWATVARDEQGFVRTQDEWETLAAYARDLASRLERLKAEQISPTQAGWLLKHAHIVATWPELAESLRRLQSGGTTDV